MEIKCNCGTLARKQFIINLDDYGVSFATSATPEEVTTAFNMLEGLMNDKHFIDDGHRNHDAVNGCIALHVLGYDPEEWFGNFFMDRGDELFWQIDIDKFEEHVERVAPYLDGWGPVNNKGQALAYAI